MVSFVGCRAVGFLPWGVELWASFVGYGARFSFVWCRDLGRFLPWGAELWVFPPCGVELWVFFRGV